MMTNAGTTQKAREGQNFLFVLILILGSLSGVIRDFERLETVTKNMHGWIASSLRAGSTIYSEATSLEPGDFTAVAPGDEENPSFQTAVTESNENFDLSGSNMEPVATENVTTKIRVAEVRRTRRSASGKTKIETTLRARSNSCQIDLGRLALLVRQIKGEKLHSQAGSEFPPTMAGQVDRPQVREAIRSILRELSLRTRDGNLPLRRRRLGNDKLEVVGFVGAEACDCPRLTE